MSTENSKIPDLRMLEAFQVAMACGSMTGAARQLGVGQPTVTRLVRDLEDSVGFQLFHRNGPRITPTDRGLRFYEEVVRLMAGMQQIHARAEAIRNERLPGLDVAATPTMAGGLIGPTLAALGQDLPDHVNLQTMSAENVVRALENRTADFGISAFPLDHAGLVRRVVCESRLVAALAEDDPLAQAATVPLSALDSARLITVGNAFRIRRTIDAALADHGVRPARELGTNSSLNAIMAARAGLGIAIVDPVSAFGIPVTGVAIRPLDVEIQYVWGLFTASGRAMPAPLRAFVTAFRETCAATIPSCIIRDPDDRAVLPPDGPVVTSPLQQEG